MPLVLMSELCSRASQWTVFGLISSLCSVRRQPDWQAAELGEAAAASGAQDERVEERARVGEEAQVRRCRSTQHVRRAARPLGSARHLGARGAQLAGLGHQRLRAPLARVVARALAALERERRAPAVRLPRLRIPEARVPSASRARLRSRNASRYSAACARCHPVELLGRTHVRPVLLLQLVAASRRHVRYARASPLATAVARTACASPSLALSADTAADDAD